LCSTLAWKLTLCGAIKIQLLLLLLLLATFVDCVGMNQPMWHFLAIDILSGCKLTAESTPMAHHVTTGFAGWTAGALELAMKDTSTAANDWRQGRVLQLSQ